MNPIFIDTSYIQALLDRRDKYHDAAMNLLPTVDTAQKQWTTQAVLLEIANALAKNRSAAVQYIRWSLTASNMAVVLFDDELFQAGLALYESRPDKQWGLTDCISFVVMQREGITLAATADQHFVQAGFRALMLE